MKPKCLIVVLIMALATCSAAFNEDLARTGVELITALKKAEQNSRNPRMELLSALTAGIDRPIATFRSARTEIRSCDAGALDLLGPRLSPYRATISSARRLSLKLRIEKLR